MIATGCNYRVIDSLIDNNSDDDDIPLNSNLETVSQFMSKTLIPPPPPSPYPALLLVI